MRISNNPRQNTSRKKKPTPHSNRNLHSHSDKTIPIIVVIIIRALEPNLSALLVPLLWLDALGISLGVASTLRCAHLSPHLSTAFANNLCVRLAKG